MCLIGQLCVWIQTHHIALQPNEVDGDWYGFVLHSIDSFDFVEEIGEKFVAAFKDTQSCDAFRSRFRIFVDIIGDVASQLLNPVRKGTAREMLIWWSQVEMEGQLPVTDEPARNEDSVQVALIMPRDAHMFHVDAWIVIGNL